MRTEQIASLYRSMAMLVALLALIGPGCSSDRLAQRAMQAGQNSSTIARDRSKIPAGQVIPPAGIGVDLVRANGGGDPGQTDPGVGLAGFSHNGVPGRSR